MPEQNTATLQHWLKTVVTSPGTLPVKIGRAQHTLQLSETDVVLQQHNAGIYERLSIYSNGYVLRLLECMGADYPALKSFLGDAVFHQFAKAYLAQNPSHSFTLYALGAAFPDFLERTRPQNRTDIDAAMFLLPAAIASVERARQEVIRAEGLEHTIPGVAESIFPMSHILQQPPCLRLLELPFPVKTFYENIIREQPYEIPAPATTYLAVSRMHYRLIMTELEHWQYELLLQCKEPTDMLQAVKHVAEKCGLQMEAIWAEIFLWLPMMREQGLVMIM
ncbi:HvfC/BufC family peptide modification chaperone [Chitinophagaceae bacterium MMS25-I14]